jgi:hypothetical protein
VTDLEQFIKDSEKPENLKRLIINYAPGLDFKKNNIEDTLYNNRTIRNGALREEVIKRYGFAILTQDIVNRLKPYQPILEVGAGLGYWAYECKKAGLDYIATDKNTPANNDYFSVDTPRWTSIETTSSRKAIEKYPDRILLICWPDYGCDWAFSTLVAYTNKYLIYVGEMESGCCANDKFFNEIDKNWSEIEDLGLKSFYCIHDSAVVYKRKTI